MPDGPTVGVVANPASGRDIRRLVAGASVFDNAEKGGMVYRLMVGLGAVGVERVLMMPAAAGVSESLRRGLLGNTGVNKQRLPELEFLQMPVKGDARDTEAAVGLLREQGVSAIAVLGGDGTSRVAARRSARVPLCALSTGTNNVFPRIRESTVAGLAMGLVATGRLGGEVIRQEKVLHVGLNGEPNYDTALVDAAVSSEQWVGARALYTAGGISEMVVTSASPHAVGLSSVAGLLDPVSRAADHGLYLRLTGPEDAETELTVPLAPGLVVKVGVAERRRLDPGDPVSLDPVRGSLALDGEREIELHPEDTVEVRLERDGPLTIDVEEAMRLAAERGLLNGSP